MSHLNDSSLLDILFDIKILTICHVFYFMSYFTCSSCSPIQHVRTFISEISIDFVLIYLLLSKGQLCKV